MRLVGIKILTKLKLKNKGNTLLNEEIDKLISDIESNNWANETELKQVRKDADRVHSDGFYFFDIAIHRTMILLEFDECGEATIVWAGSHDEYERTFKNDKRIIAKWLKSKNYL